MTSLNWEDLFSTEPFVVKDSDDTNASNNDGSDNSTNSDIDPSTAVDCSVVQEGFSLGDWEAESHPNPGEDSVHSRVDAETIEVLFAEKGVTEEELSDERLKDAVNEYVITAQNRDSTLTEFESASEVEKSLNVQIAELQAQINALKSEQAKAKDYAWDLRIKHRHLVDESSNKAAAANVVLDDLRKSKEFDLLTSSFEDRAAHTKWWNGINNGDAVMKVMPHQWDAMRFMASTKRCILGDEMGLGKTLSAIGALDLLDAKRVLIVSPADITGNFKEEIDMWSDRAGINIKGETKAVRKAMLTTVETFFPKFYVTVNYEAWRKDHSLIEQLIDMHFDTIICDEAHIMKDSSTVAFKGVNEIVTANNFCPLCKKNKPYTSPCETCGWFGQSWNYRELGLKWDEAIWLTRSIRNVFPMTGTPILNKPDDLWPLLNLIDPVNFNSKSSYLSAYAEWDYEKKMWTFAWGGVERLLKRLGGKFLARTLADANIVLPPQKPIIHILQPDPELHAGQIAVMQQLAEHAEIVLTEDKRMSVAAVIALITRQRQAATYPGGIVIKDETGAVVWAVSDEVKDSVKFDKVLSLCEEFTATGQRIVVFSQFSGALHELQNRLNGTVDYNGNPIRSVIMDGSTPSDLRDRIRTNFNRQRGEEAEWEVVLANYKTGGTGLNLTAATHTIILDREWNPGKENQGLARTHRIGQTETTFVHILEVEDSIDEWMRDIIENKGDMISGFDDGAKQLKDELLSRLRKRSK